MSQETLARETSDQRCILVQGAEWSVHDCTATAAFACMTLGSQQAEGQALLQKWSRLKHSDHVAEPVVATDSAERVRRHPHAVDCTTYVHDFVLDGPDDPCITVAPTSPPTEWHPCYDMPCANGGLCSPGPPPPPTQPIPARLPAEDDFSGDDDNGSGSGDSTPDPPTARPDIPFTCQCFPGWHGPTCEDTLAPTPAPTPMPTPAPTAMPTGTPTAMPTGSPTPAPTPMPTGTPTAMPTRSPTPAPTPTPTPAPTAMPTGSPTPAPTAMPTVSPTPSPTAMPTSAPTLMPTGSPTISCESLFEIASANFPGGRINFEPGTSARGVVVEGQPIDPNGANSVTAANLGPTKISVKVSFMSTVWGPDEPKVALRLTNEAHAGQSFIVSRSVNITRDNACADGRFQTITEHPSTNPQEMRTLRYGVGVAELTATVGSWAPKVPGYKLEVFLLKDAWNAATPPQAVAVIEDIDLGFHHTYIDFKAHVDGMHRNAQRMLPYSHDMALTINASWAWPTQLPGPAVDIVAIIRDARCPANNCVAGWPEYWPVGAVTGESTRGVAAGSANMVLTINLKPQTPVDVLDTLELVLYLQDAHPACEASDSCHNRFQQARLAESNRWSFRVYASGVAAGEMSADETSGSDTAAMSVTTASGLVGVAVASVVLVAAIGLAAFAYRR